MEPEIRYFRKIKKFTETDIYRSFIIIHQEYAKFFKNFENGYKMSIGVDLDNSFIQCLMIFKMIFLNKNNKELIHNIDELSDEISLKLKLCFESYQCMSQNQFASLMSKFAKSSALLITAPSYDLPKVPDTLSII